jgi:hypothetical protein
LMMRMRPGSWLIESLSFYIHFLQFHWVIHALILIF